MRIQKLLSRAGVASRREAETLMLEGRVSVNGALATTLGARVDPERDVVEVDGRRIRMAAVRWIALNKPVDTLVTRADPHGGRTVYDCLRPEHATLRYVGRLDRETEGLLLFTNDGELAHRLLHPSAGVEREYRVGLRGRAGPEVVRTVTGGVVLDDGPARALRAGHLGDEPEGSVLRLVLSEGRKREVRRLMSAAGHSVRWLRRERFGPVRLGSLPAAAWRELTPGELAALRRAAGGAGGEVPGAY